MPHLFDPLTLRGLSFPNRVFVSPMCQYSCDGGLATRWHLVHLGSRAIGGAGLVMTEATAVSPEGRISPADLGIWSPAHVPPLREVAAFVRAHGAVAGIQLAHAGRKASTEIPWVGRGAVGPDRGGWTPLAPSAEPFAPDYAVPRAMSAEDIDRVVVDFRAAAARALEAGFQVVELHMAHGYLLHEFLSPLSNHRSDAYGGGFDDRARLPLRVALAVRRTWPDELPVFVRISATDWVDGGWSADDSVRLAQELRGIGVDLIDCSSGGIVPNANIPAAPGYQVPFADRVRSEARIATAAVGLITEAAQADAVVSAEQADAVMLARAVLRDPYWALHAAHALGVDVRWPSPYLRAAPARPA
ncbi:MAG TPA: NADH:flavin oxidoreductase/NADH oxidase [Polyangiaceae bacterium]|nr:NADH:flavin oxidoreductase/NADH oxidase [Polyangiaceae bacterium]